MRKAKRLLSEHAPDLYAEIVVWLTNDPYWYPDVDIPSLGCHDDVAVFWQCRDCNNRWQNTVLNRYRHKSGCPFCTNRIILHGFNCLKTIHPEIFEELHPTLNKEAGIDIGTLAPKSNERVWWQCPVNPEHVWQNKVYVRTSISKSGCPHCFIFRNEKEFRELFNTKTNIIFQSGHIIAERELFKRNKVQIDIVNHEHKIAIEYDGHFTHGGNTLYKTTKEECFAKDTDSTQAILNAGYTIIRIRETPLANLALKHPDLKQLKYKNRTDKAETLQAAIAYLQSRNKPIHLAPSPI